MATNLGSQDWHELLGVSYGADLREIKRAVRLRVRACHPDVHPHKEEAEQELKRVVQAYRMLCDERFRSRYDRIQDAFRAAGPNAPGQTRAYRAPAWPFARISVKHTSRWVAALVVVLLLGRALVLEPSQAVNIDPAHTVRIAEPIESMGLGDWYSRNWWSVWYFEQGVSSGCLPVPRQQMVEYLTQQARSSYSRNHPAEAARLMYLARIIGLGPLSR